MSFCKINVKITELASEKKPLFCKRDGILLTPSVLKKHHCLSKRTYTNKQGEEVQIVCPHCCELKEAKPLYQSLPSKTILLNDGEQAVAVESKVDIFQKEEEAINKIKKAYLELNQDEQNTKN